MEQTNLDAALPSREDLVARLRDSEATVRDLRLEIDAARRTSVVRQVRHMQAEIDQLRAEHVEATRARMEQRLSVVDYERQRLLECLTSPAAAVFVVRPGPNDERSRADVVATDLAEAQRTLEEHVVQLAGAGREYSDEVMCERRRADLAAKELAEAQWAFEASEEHAQKVAVATSATTDELAHERRRAAAAAVELAEAHRALETSEEEFNEQLACANAEVQRIREIVDVLRRELQEAQVTIHETQVQLKGSDIRCDALQATSQHREDRVQELEGLLRDRAAQVGELQDVVQQRDVRLREIENLLCQRDIRVAELERKNSERPSPSRFVAEATCRLQIANLVGGRAAARLNVGHASRSSGESRAVGGRLPPPGGGAIGESILEVAAQMSAVDRELSDFQHILARVSKVSEDMWATRASSCNKVTRPRLFHDLG
eukprot:CAMPEP_0170219208 /NCGR_PEP_ID=MMETSP0116_2-20130129/9279_1 /TAXON_ID=400756 /ORGANISM="Durinskia baltica, Strain CSIRO CS-38" /LENGTH=432 /DNA_ID=CAMNT_0010469861 /DNA_START=80 /DNA_END=1380 /DNA_ORIENTATION=+